jgi:hypothetical protein
MTGWYVAILCVAAIALGVNAVETDSNGLQSEDHREALPAQVVKLSPQSYIIERGAIVTTEQICKGDNSDTDDEPYEVDHPVPQLDNATFAQCDLPQRWDARGASSPNFGESILLTLTTPGWFIPTGIALLLNSVWPLFLVGTERRRKKVAAKLAKEREYNKLLERYRAYQGAYARDEINDLEFDARIKKLVEEDGFELPDKGLFAK